MKKTLALSALALMALPLAAQTSDDTPRTGKHIDEVTVYGTRSQLPLKRLPNKVEVISPEVIARSGDFNLTDLLKNHSSVDVIQYTGYLSQIGMRGFRPGGKYTTALVDGLPIGTDNISTLSTVGLAQVEVLKGPFSSIYGTSAMGGVLNLVTKKHKGELTGHANITAGSFQTLRLSQSIGGRIVGGLNFDLALAYDNQINNYKIGKHSFFNRSELEETIIDKNSYGAKFPATSYSAFNGRVRLGYDFNDRWSLNVYETIFYGKGLKSAGSFWEVYGADKKDVKRSSTSLELQGRLGTHQLSLKPYFNREDNIYYEVPGPQYVNFKSKDYSYGVVLQDNFQIGGQDFVVGLDSRNVRSQTNRYNATGAIAPYRPSFLTNNLGAYAQANLKFLRDRLYVSAGLRADFLRAKLEADSFLGNSEDSETYSQISPNLGLKYEIVKGLQAHASFGQSFTAPDAYQKAGLYATSYNITKGNPDLEPEYSTTYDLGLGYVSPDQTLMTDVTFFATRHKNMIVSTYDYSTTPLYTVSYANADKGRMAGLEILLSYDIARSLGAKFSLRPYANATFMFYSENLPKGKTEWVDNEYIRKQNITFGLEYADLKRWTVSLSGRYAGKRTERNQFSYYPTVRPSLSSVQTLQHPKSMVFHAAVSYRLWQAFTLSLNVQNLLDENYTEKDGYNMPGRTILFGATYRF